MAHPDHRPASTSRAIRLAIPPPASPAPTHLPTTTWPRTMRKAAKTLIAGMVIAIPLLPLLGGVATSQSTVVSDQTQSGAVVASQSLDVDTVTDQTAATTTATGNTLSGAVDANSLDVQSTQALQNDVTADTQLNVNTDASQAISLSSVATGNTGEADALGAGALTGSFSQDAGS